jgi:hypothetical protein
VLKISLGRELAIAPINSRLLYGGMEYCRLTAYCSGNAYIKKKDIESIVPGFGRSTQYILLMNSKFVIGNCPGIIIPKRLVYDG